MARIVRITRWPLVAVVITVLVLLSYRIVVHDREARAAILPMVFFTAPSANEVLGAMHRAGLDAKSLAAAGVSDEDVPEVVSDLYAYLIANPTALSSADTAYGEARTAHDELVRLVRSGTAEPEEITALATVSSALATAAAARDAAVEALFTAATDSLDEGEVLLLNMLRSNREGWRNIPVEFLTIEREESDWLALRNALAEERIVAAGGEGAGPEGALSSASQTLLSNARSNGTVSIAITNLNTNLALIESAVATAAASPPE